jgi:hypothetical protein
MFREERNSAAPPDYYNGLNTKQKSNWRKNTRKIERNEELKSTYPPYHTPSNMIVVHLHHQTEVETVEQLIKKAEQTELYALDTESQSRNRRNYGALIQIQMVHSTSCSTMILIEVNFLPNPASTLYRKMEKLWSTIFSNRHEIISWGPYEKEMENFNELNLIQSGKSFRKSNLQLQFQNWFDGKAHPEMERRDHESGFELDVEASDDDDIFNYDIHDGQNKLGKNKSSTEWSLQEAVATIFNKFLDKTETENYWQCGIDVELGTWKQKLFSKKQYDQQIEQEQRLKMKEYAIHDCTALSELYFHMYPAKLSIYQEITTTTTTTSTTSTASTTFKITTMSTSPSRIFYMNNNDELSDISEDELIEILKPKFDQRPSEPTVTAETTTTTTVTTSSEEKKQEQQRRRNEKFKEKKKNNPEFQNKILRPMYYQYDYRKVRAQLADDNIYHTHQITFNPDHTEVMIVFKSNEEKERAKSIIKINYFSRDQYVKRWSGR